MSPKVNHDAAAFFILLISSIRLRLKTEVTAQLHYIVSVFWLLEGAFTVIANKRVEEDCSAWLDD